MCPCRFILGDERTVLVSGVDNAGGCASPGVGGGWEISVHASQLSCGPKTAIKNKAFKNKTKISIAFIYTDKNQREDNSERDGPI